MAYCCTCLSEISEVTPVNNVAIHTELIGMVGCAAMHASASAQESYYTGIPLHADLTQHMAFDSAMFLDFKSCRTVMLNRIN